MNLTVAAKLDNQNTISQLPVVLTGRDKGFTKKFNCNVLCGSLTFVSIQVYP